MLGEGAARPLEELIQVADAVIHLRGASPPEYRRPLTALVANPPWSDEAENAFASSVPCGSPLRYVPLRRSKGHAAGIFSLQTGGSPDQPASCPLLRLRDGLRYAAFPVLCPFPPVPVPTQGRKETPAMR